MRILILGCNGLLGQNLIQTAPSHAVLMGISAAPQPALPDRLEAYRSINITQSVQLARAIREMAPDRIVNAAAMTDVDGCERNPELCRAVNYEAVAALADLNLPLVHLSTDYVFDGVAGPYTETDAIQPLSVYGLSKADSEIAVLSGHRDNLVVRTMLLWGIGKGAKTQFPVFIRGNLTGGKRVRIVTDQWGHPTLAVDLAQAIWHLLAKGCQGLYHAAGAELTSRLGWTQSIARFYDLDESLIDTCLTADLGQAARRPLKSGLISAKLTRDTGFVLRGVQDQLLALMPKF
jgi:dTDP-4-dehydrorhamnose reductase